jgi:hypothetical protein
MPIFFTLDFGRPLLLPSAPSIRDNGVHSCEVHVMQEPSCEGFLLSMIVGAGRQ